MTAAQQETGLETAAVTMALSDSDADERGDEDTEALLQRGATASPSASSGNRDGSGWERDSSSSPQGARQSLTAAFSWVWDAGVVCCVVSSLTFSLNAVIVKYLHDVPVFEIAVARSGISFIISYSLVREEPMPGEVSAPAFLPTPSHSNI